MTQQLSCFRAGSHRCAGVARVWFALCAALGLFAALPSETRGQTPAQPVRIGYLIGGSCPAPSAAQVTQFLLELGHAEGKNVLIECRGVAGQFDRLPEAARALMEVKPDVIVAFTNLPAFAARQATAKVPIVVWGAHGALETGLVGSLARPGGNVTGVESLAPELDAKRLESLKQIAPTAKRIAVLYNANDQGSPVHLQSTRAAAEALGIGVMSLEVRQPSDFDGALAELARNPPDGLLTFTDPLTFNHWKRVAEHAAAHRLATICEFRQMAAAGCLLSYGPEFSEISRINARQVDRIIKGARPGDLPVERPTRYSLVVNLKTAKAIGLTIPQSLLLRADEVIE